MRRLFRGPSVPSIYVEVMLSPTDWPTISLPNLNLRMSRYRLYASHL